MRSIATALKDAGRVFYVGFKAGTRYSFMGTAVSPARLLLLVAAGIVSVWVTTVIINRVAAEQSNNVVELCLDFNETVDLCQKNGYPLSEFLERCRLVGATSIAFGEETPGTMASSGIILCFPSVDRHRGTLSAMLSAGRNTVATADDVLRQQTLDQLKERYGIAATVSRAGNLTVIAPELDAPFMPSFWTETMPLGFGISKIAFIKERGYRPVIKVQNAGNPRWLSDGLPAGVTTILFDGREVPGYPGDEQDFADIVRENGLRIVAVEFLPVAGMDKLKILAPQQVVLGHTVSAKELGQSRAFDAVRARWQRAVRERGVRFVLFHFFPNRSIEENMKYLRSTASDIKMSGYALDQTVPPDYPHQESHRGRLFLALATVVGAPLVALVTGMRRRNPIAAYISANIVTLAAGLLVAALLFDGYYMQKIVEMPAVKLTMLMPLLLAPFILYRREERHRLWRMELRVGHLAIAGLILALVALLFVRSGNTSAVWLQPDQGMRQFVENLLSIRPRTKEFLFGQPLLFLGFFFKRKELLWLGVVGQLSMMNTFLHAHTPVMLSFVRSLHGIWLGLLVAGATALVWSFLRARRPRY